MSLAFNRGEEVRLKPKVAETFAANPRSGIKNGWKTRIGIVRWCNGHTVLVVWHGRSSGDSLPLAAVERVGAVG